MDKAKELFMAYEGSQYYMWHDGVIDEYMSFKIPHEQEEEWRRELGRILLEKVCSDDNNLSGSFFGLTRICKQNDDVEKLKIAMDFIVTQEKYDALSQLVTCEHMQSEFKGKGLKFFKGDKAYFKDRLFKLIEMAASNPVIFSNREPAMIPSENDVKMRIVDCRRSLHSMFKRGWIWLLFGKEQ